MTPAHRPSLWTLAASVLIHAFIIVLMLTKPPGPPPPVRFARVTAIASPYRAPAPRTPGATPHDQKATPRVPTIRTLHTAVRAFRAPQAVPQSAPLALPVADPPALPQVDLPSLELAPPLVDLPPPPIRRPVVAVGAFDRTNPSIPAAARAEATTGTFGDATTAAPAGHARQSSSANSLAAEILSKPRPAYTDEARRLRIEGEVLLEVLFEASGEARVLRTVHGLGHGLDDNAIAAARAIRFRPAQRGGHAVDSSAVVHIVFQLAN